MTPNDIIKLSQELAEARDALMHAADAMISYKGKGHAHRLDKAEELLGAARTIQEWIETGEPDGYQ